MPLGIVPDACRWRDGPPRRDHVALKGPIKRHLGQRLIPTHKEVLDRALDVREGLPPCLVGSDHRLTSLEATLRPKLVIHDVIGQCRSHTIIVASVIRIKEFLGQLHDVLVCHLAFSSVDTC